MTIRFSPVIKKKRNITYIEDRLIQSDTKTKMFDQLRSFYQIFRKSKLKAAPSKTYIFPDAVKNLGQKITKNKIRPLSNKIEAIQQTKHPKSKQHVEKLLGALNCCSKVFPNLHVILGPLYTL